MKIRDLLRPEGIRLGATAECDVTLRTDDYSVEGRAAVESHYPLYMFDQGM